MKKKKNTKPSPLRNYWGKDYDAKDMSGDISGAMDRFSSIDASENLWAGAKNQFADVSNAFQGIQQDFTNRFEGVNIKDPTRDLTNRFQGLQNRFAENVYEDLTVNQQQAQFEAQQGAQQRSNIMETMRGAAGGSGIAALAQTMANQGQLATQRASASIGQQEAANQRAAAQQAGQIQTMERTGAQQAERNANDGISMLQTAEGGLNEVSRVLIRLRELSVQSSSDTVGNKEREFANLEFQNMKKEIERICYQRFEDMCH